MIILFVIILFVIILFVIILFVINFNIYFQKLNLSMTTPTPIFQNTNILDNFYNDGNFNYVLSSTINAFPDIVAYIIQTQPNYCPTYTNPDNRLLYNTNNLYEINFHKNIITLFPVIITNHQTFQLELEHIKKYLETFCITHENKNDRLLSFIQYKLFIYSPYSLSTSSLSAGSTSLNFNMYKTPQTILNIKLIEPMFESHAISICQLNNSGNTNNSTFQFSGTQPKHLKQQTISFALPTNQVQSMQI